MAVTLETPRLLLRPHTLADFEPWMAMFADPVALRFLAFTGLSQEDGWNRLLRYAGHWSLLGFGLFAVLEKASGRFVGEVGHADFHRGLGRPSIPARRRRGSSRPRRRARATPPRRPAPPRTGSTRSGVRRRLVCIINPANRPSLGLAAKLGYRPFDTRIVKGNPYTMLAREA